MQEKPIDGAEQATPEWLTDVLYRKDVLSQGQVTRVKSSRPQSGFSSVTWHLDVSYSEDALPYAPQKLFLKCSNVRLVPGESSPDKIRKEVDYYQSIDPLMSDAPSVPCYAAAYDPQTEASHLLLLDVTETHAVCLDPRYEQNAQRAAKALGRLHAAWWDHPQLGDSAGGLPTIDKLEANWADGAQRTDAFIQMLGDRLPGTWRDIYERVIQSLPNLYRRHLSGRDLTLVHGDAHLGNFLFPHASNGSSTYMIDWQFWHATIGGTDLAFMMAAKWQPEVRCRLEKPLLRRYHATLLEHGVTHYEWNDCWNDYRLSVILVSLFIPVWQWSIFKWEADIKAVERGITAFNELECSELL